MKFVDLRPYWNHKVTLTTKEGTFRGKLELITMSTVRDESKWQLLNFKPPHLRKRGEIIYYQKSLCNTEILSCRRVPTIQVEILDEI